MPVQRAFETKLIL